jgi:hypothetical protein
VLREANVTLFVAASLALIATPGPDMIYVLTRGVAQGRRAALVSACGVCSGLAVHTSFAAIGLSALLARSAVAFSVVKYAGAAYLIYLGIKTLSSKEPLAISEEKRQTTGLGGAFLQGVVSNVLNPKVALFFLAFFAPVREPGCRQRRRADARPRGGLRDARVALSHARRLLLGFFGREARGQSSLRERPALVIGQHSRGLGLAPRAAGAQVAT